MTRVNAQWLAEAIANQGFEASASVYTGGGFSGKEVWAVKCDIGSAFQSILEMLSEDFDSPPEKFGRLEVATHIGEGTYIY